MDPFTERDALQEAQLLALRFDAVTGTAALLFELRVALQMREGNTGVLAATDVRRLVWSGAERPMPFTAWTVGGSVASIEVPCCDSTWGCGRVREHSSSWSLEPLRSSPATSRGSVSCRRTTSRTTSTPFARASPIGTRT